MAMLTYAARPGRVALSTRGRRAGVLRVAAITLSAEPLAGAAVCHSVAGGLYSVPGELIGQRVDVRTDTHLVGGCSRGQLNKTHPRVHTRAFVRHDPQITT